MVIMMKYIRYYKVYYLYFQWSSILHMLCTQILFIGARSNSDNYENIRYSKGLSNIILISYIL